MAGKPKNTYGLSAYKEFEHAQQRKLLQDAADELSTKNGLAALGNNPNVWGLSNMPTNYYGITTDTDEGMRKRGVVERFSVNPKEIYSKHMPSVVFGGDITAQGDTLAHEFSHRGIAQLYPEDQSFPEVEQSKPPLTVIDNINNSDREEIYVRLLDYMINNSNQTPAEAIGYLQDEGLPPPDKLLQNPNILQWLMDVQKQAEMLLQQEGRRTENHLLTQEEKNTLDMSLGDMFAAGRRIP